MRYRRTASAYGPKQQAAIDAVYALLHAVDDAFDLEFVFDEWAEAVDHILALETIVMNHGHQLDDPPYQHQSYEE
jgi:hypothetical protein